ncbi:hypothetical protein [Streptomyces boluensis]|uniref:Uncharacterized protein n=1 Tax=Streptomyces boluensis TaxID=1775135 RepID=A0A964URI2_9ACTN|nr:hypothetical protein [Streptomyces boluensis]NBE53966.1 hypothetical protein [Streptomyces boluensis]
MLERHEELVVEVSIVSRVGCIVRITETDIEGFIDQSQRPSWRGDAAPPQIGDELHAVVIDPHQNPPRLSALDRDIATADNLRRGDLVTDQRRTGLDELGMR